jgi:choline dehydrogenase-like flavoprotein
VLIRSGSLPDGTALRSDVAIVGSGPAGLSLAEGLADRRCRVLILESGPVSRRRCGRRPLMGESTGQPFPIATSRARGFGGTSQLWLPGTGLRARRLDAIDFQPSAVRSGLGWPYSADELEPFYQRAYARLGLDPGLPDAEWLPDPGVSAEDGSKLAAFQFVDRSVFADSLGQVADSPWIELMPDATVRAIEVSPDTGEVAGLEVTSGAGSRLRIEATRYVLAGGAIENARLLLESPGLSGAGVGNEYDQVGRWFMDHLCVDTGIVVPSRPGAFNTAPYEETTTAGGARNQPMLWLGEGAIRRQNLLNAAFWVFRARPGYLSQGVQSIRTLRQGLETTPRLPGAPAQLLGALRGWRQAARYELSRSGKAAGGGPLVMRALGEQVPDACSRVTLSDRRDAHGRRRVKLNWRVNPEDVWHLRRHQELLAEGFERHGVGTIIDNLPSDGTLPLFWTNHHHLGGTRMHADHKRGVVDDDCRVHSARNLFVVGGSVFPTGGYVNPTLTIMALAIRTADVIRGELGQPPLRLSETEIRDHG